MCRYWAIAVSLFTLQVSAQSLPKFWPTPTPSERQRMAGELGLGPTARKPAPSEWQRKMKELGMGVAGSGVGASTAGPNPMDLCDGVVRTDASDVHGRNLTQTLNQESTCNVSESQPQVDQFRNLVESVRAAQTRELAQELRSQDFRDSIFAFWSAHERMRGKLASADEALSQLMSGWDTWMRKSRREYTSQNEAMILKGALLKYWNQYQALPARKSFTRWTDADWAKKVTEFNATQKEAQTLCSQIYHESEQARAASERSGGDPYYERNRQQDQSAQAYQANTKQVRVRAFSVLKKELQIKYQEKIEALNARISDSAGAILFTQEPNRKSYPPIHLDQCMNEGRSVPSLTTDKLKSEIDPFFTAIREKVFEAQYSLVKGPDSADIRRLLATDPALIVKWLDQNKSNPQRVAILCSQILELYERDEIRNYFKVAGQVVAGTAGLVLMATGVGAALGAPLAMGATLTGALTATTYFGSTVATAAMVSEASSATSEMAGLENSLASRPEGSGITARSLRQADERSAVANAELKEDLIWTWAPEAGIGALGSLRKLKGVASQDSGLEAFAKSLDEAHPNLSPVERKVLIERVAKAETKALTSEWLKTNIAEIKSAQRPKVAGVRTTPQTTEPVPALPSRRVSPNERMDGGMTWDLNPVAPEPIRLEALPEGSSSVRITDANRSETASELLGRSLSESESAALQEAHEVGRGQAGKDPTRSASIGNYTSEQLRAKTKILRKAGFSDAEASVLLRKGLAGDAGELDPSLIRRELAREYPLHARRLEQLVVRDQGRTSTCALHAGCSFLEANGVFPDGQTLDLEYAYGLRVWERINKLIDSDTAVGPNEVSAALSRGNSTTDLNDFFAGRGVPLIDIKQAGVTPNMFKPNSQKILNDELTAVFNSEVGKAEKQKLVDQIMKKHFGEVRVNRKTRAELKKKNFVLLVPSDRDGIIYTARPGELYKRQVNDFPTAMNIEELESKARPDGKWYISIQTNAQGVQIREISDMKARDYLQNLEKGSVDDLKASKEGYYLLGERYKRVTYDPISDSFRGPHGKEIPKKILKHVYFPKKEAEPSIIEGSHFVLDKSLSSGLMRNQKKLDIPLVGMSADLPRIEKRVLGELKKGKAVLALFSKTNYWNEVWQYDPNSSGRHAVVIVGAKQNPDGSLKEVLILNSWGENAGRQGFYKLPWTEDVAKQLAGVMVEEAN